MKTVIGIAVLFMAFVVGCERHEDPAKVREAIETMDKQFVEAFNRQDVDGIMTSYWNSPNLVVWYPDEDLQGYDAVRASWERTFREVDVKHFSVDQRNIEVGHHMAYDWGNWTYTFQPKGAPEEMTIKGRYLQVWAEKDGKWLVVADHASVPLPPPQPPQPTAAQAPVKKK
jgi:ketosteroid isomerase-like protein